MSHFGGSIPLASSLKHLFFEMHAQLVVKKMSLMCKKDSNPEINTAAPQLLDYGEVFTESTVKRASSTAGLRLKISGFSSSSLK